MLLIPTFPVVRPASSTPPYRTSQAPDLMIRPRLGKDQSAGLWGYDLRRIK